MHVKSWEWFELSAVTVPANSKTTIQRIKSLDAEHRAALGAAPVDPRSPRLALQAQSRES